MNDLRLELLTMGQPIFCTTGGDNHICTKKNSKIYSQDIDSILGKNLFFPRSLMVIPMRTTIMISLN